MIKNVILTEASSARFVSTNNIAVILGSVIEGKNYDIQLTGLSAEEIKKVLACLQESK